MKLTAKKFSIPVSNQDRAVKFYRDTLGFEVVRDEPFGPGQRWIELRLPGQNVELVLFTPDEHKARVGTFQHVLFTAPDVFRAYEEMKAKGVEFPMPPKQEPWGVSSVFKDVDGNSFSLASEG